MFKLNLKTKEHPEGELIERKFTPTSKITQKGYVDFPIKIYRKNQHIDYPEGGLISSHLENLEIGNEVRMKGPLGRMQYKGNGHFELGPHKMFNSEDLTLKGKTNIGMIAGGTGITPIFSMIQASLNEDDSLKMSLLYACKSDKDIWFKDELDEYAAVHPERFKV